MKPNLKLLGTDGNVFNILAKARTAFERAGMEDQWEEFKREATSGDYNKAIRTCMKYFDVK